MAAFLAGSLVYLDAGYQAPEEWRRSPANVKCVPRSATTPFHICDQLNAGTVFRRNRRSSRGTFMWQTIL